MGNASELMATSTTATLPSVSGAIIELYAATTPRGGHRYVVEVGGLAVAESTERDQAAGVYRFLLEASQPVVYALVSQVMAADRTPLEV